MNGYRTYDMGPKTRATIDGCLFDVQRGRWIPDPRIPAGPERMTAFRNAMDRNMRESTAAADRMAAADMGASPERMALIRARARADVRGSADRTMWARLTSPRDLA